MLLHQGEPFRMTYTVSIAVCSLPLSRNMKFNISVIVLPYLPRFDIAVIEEESIINFIAIPLFLEASITEEIDRLLSGKIENFFDNERQLKTLLNFGTDYQALITNWKLDESNTTGQGLILKLYKPLPSEVAPRTSVFISRELSYPTVEKISVIESPTPLPNVYLRYPNKRLKVAGRTGGVVNNVTLNTLLTLDE